MKAKRCECGAFMGALSPKCRHCGRDATREFRERLFRDGTSVSAWAREHGFKVNLVFEVLAGRAKGRRGQSHRIAVLLGLKEGEIR